MEIVNMFSAKTFATYHEPLRKLYDPFRSPKIDDTPFWLSRLREGLRMSKAQLAKAIGVTPTTVSDWEKGKYEPSAEAYIKLFNLESPANSMWYLEKAGVNLARALGVIGRLLQERGVALTEKQLAAVPEIAAGSFEMHEDVAARLLKMRRAEMRKLITGGEIKGRQIDPSGAYIVEFDSVQQYGLRKGITAKALFDTFFSITNSWRKREKKRLKAAKP
jgi:DNA-binding XRE family transcriptional regulator